jgi:hypothetical protein
MIQSHQEVKPISFQFMRSADQETVGRTDEGARQIRAGGLQGESEERLVSGNQIQLLDQTRLAAFSEVEAGLLNLAD